MSEAPAVRRMAVPLLIAVSIGNFLVAFDASAINVAVPQIINELGGTTTDLQWILDGYTIPLCAFLFLSGVLGDRYGAFRVYRWATVAFLASSIGCALAWSTPVLVGMRLMQGAAASFMLPMTLAIIAASEPDPNRRARAVGVWGVVGGCAIALGPLIGGALSEVLTWRSIFWLNLPVCAAALLVIRKHHSTPGNASRKISALSQGLLLCFLFSVAWVLISMAHGQLSTLWLVLAWVFVALVAAALVITDRRAQTPMIPEQLWQDRSFLRLTSAGAIYQFCSYGSLLVFTLWASSYQQSGPLSAGMLVLPCSVAWLCGNLTVWASRPGWRLRIIAAGTVTGFLGALASIISSGESSVVLMVGMILVGFASGLLASTLSAQAMHVAPGEVSGAASGMFNTSRQFGMVVAVATIGGIGFETGLLPQFSIVIVGFAVILALVFYPGKTRRTRPLENHGAANRPQAEVTIRTSH
ncbi:MULTISPECIES: MFS transporter [unclassified Paenarthrobacter]|uniref:MFS transporter n=1 Tax=unclassified Paenarthrobacter TaxID=2634190 RepID=UPI001F46767B|nr:MFS transporter [Paenarthrobacter sp. AR 02]MCF3138244.1 MFS transporter [Paenarthrobacter sp. AR 02]